MPATRLPLQNASSGTRSRESYLVLACIGCSLTAVLALATFLYVVDDMGLGDRLIYCGLLLCLVYCCLAYQLSR